jgi:hypothetical protein
MVERELKAALIHCGRRLGKNVVQRFGPKSPEHTLYKNNDECGPASNENGN